MKSLHFTLSLELDFFIRLSFLISVIFIFFFLLVKKAPHTTRTYTVSHPHIQQHQTQTQQHQQQHHQHHHQQQHITQEIPTTSTTTLGGQLLASQDIREVARQLKRLADVKVEKLKFDIARFKFNNPGFSYNFNPS